MTWLNRCHFGDCRDTMRAMATDYGWKRVCADFETHNVAIKRLP